VSSFNYIPSAKSDKGTISVPHTAQELAAALPCYCDRCPKHYADGWYAHCPAHGDRNPSLLIRPRDKEGRVGFFECKAECPETAVVAALQEMELSPFEAVYPYEDEEGRILYEVVRYTDKEFRPRRPNANGGWQFTLGDVRRVLYRLPEVLAASREQLSS
jgi:putative DNA primase/helicase